MNLQEFRYFSRGHHRASYSPFKVWVFLYYRFRVWNWPIFSFWVDAFAVCFPRQWASRTVFGHPTLGGLIIQKIEAQNVSMDGSPFFIVQGPDEVSIAHLTLPLEKCATTNGDLLLGPQMSGREVIPPHRYLHPSFSDPLLDYELTGDWRVVKRVCDKTVSR